MLNKIQEKLNEVYNKVYYGAIDSEEIKGCKWDYIVFNNGDFKVGKNKSSYSDTYVVTVVRENWIPEGTLECIINKMCEIPGMKFIEKDYPYSYVKKPGTDFVVQFVSLEFVKSRKVES